MKYSFSHSGQFSINRWVYFGINGDLKRENIPLNNNTEKSSGEKDTKDKISFTEEKKPALKREKGKVKNADQRGHIHYRKSKYRNMLVEPSKDLTEDVSVKRGMNTKNSVENQDSKLFDILRKHNKPAKTTQEEDNDVSGLQNVLRNSKGGKEVFKAKNSATENFKDQIHKSEKRSYNKKTRNENYSSRRNLARNRNILSTEISDAIFDDDVMKLTKKPPGMKRSHTSYPRQRLALPSVNRKVIDVTNNGDDDDDDDDDGVQSEVKSFRKQSNKLSLKEEKLYHEYLNNRDSTMATSYLQDERDKRDKIPNMIDAAGYFKYFTEHPEAVQNEASGLRRKLERG